MTVITAAVPAWAGDFFAPAPTVSAPRAQYDAGGTGRRMRGWNPPTSGPNRAIKNLQKIRDRSRDASRNDWTGTAGVQRWKTNLVGTGIVPRFKEITNRAKRKRYGKLWNTWCKQSDADCVLNFYGQQALATGSWLESGEVFARLRYRRVNSGMKVPLQVQLIEADMVPMLDADTYPGLPTGNRIRSGIELDRSGQRIAYWVYKEHPADGATGTIDISQLLRIPASQMLHIYEPKRPSQLRGVPDFAPVLARLRNVADFDDAVLERQKLGNLFTAFITKPVPTAADGLDPMTGQPIEYGDSGEPLAPLAPGLIQELLPGEGIEFANPPEAGTTYADYMRQQNIGTAAGQHLPYELMSGDIKEVSDRTLRVIINEFRRYAEQRQWHVLIPMLCQKVLDAWVDQAVLMGEIARGDAEDCKAAEWAPQGWAYIHPVQDAQGKKIEIDSGTRSRSSVIAERGYDPEEVDDERAADKAREDALGLTVVPPAAGAPAKPAKAGKKAGNEDDNIAPNEYPRNQLPFGMQLIQALTENLPALIAAFAPRGPDANQQALDAAELALRQKIAASLGLSHEQVAG